MASGIFFCSRLWKTQEMRGRSSGAPVSFSMMEASVIVCSRSSVTAGARVASAFRYSSSARAIIFLSTASSLNGRVKVYVSG